MSSGETSFGILACGSYWPRWRIARGTIAEAIGWTRGRSKAAPGQRSFAHWDEDSITMAVEACQATLRTTERSPEALELVSTTLPFAERSNAGLVAEALNLAGDIPVLDRTGTRRAATSALSGAFRSQTAQLICASDCVDAQPGSEGESELGHGASAMLLGHGQPLARLLASAGINEDFVDRYRMNGQRFDYRLEARWARDAGTRSQVKALVDGVLEEAGLGPGDIDWFLMPAAVPVVKAVARDCGVQDAETASELEQGAGLCGVAQPLLMLHYALSQAVAGQKIMLLGMGQGFDALLLEVTGQAPANGLADPVEEEPNYTRYLGMRDLLAIDRGMRAERDNRSSQSAAYRHHATLNGLLGGRCSACGKLQFPAAAICVHCHSEGEQALESMAAMTGEVNSFTEDWLAYAPRPPLIFGNVHFPGGANIMLEFTDFQAGELEAGMPVRMAFRIKDVDDRRSFRRYFWKPAPARADTPATTGSKAEDRAAGVQSG